MRFEAMPDVDLFRGCGLPSQNCSRSSAQRGNEIPGLVRTTAISHITSTSLRPNVANPFADTAEITKTISQKTPQRGLCGCFTPTYKNENENLCSLPPAGPAKPRQRALTANRPYHAFPHLTVKYRPHPPS